MKESIEALEAKANRKIGCQVPGCQRMADWQPFVEIPAIEGLDRSPPEAEIEFVLCHEHMINIDPLQFIGKPVRDAIEANLIRWSGRPLVNPVEWASAVVGYRRLLTIRVKEG